MDPPVTFGGWLFQSRKALGLSRREFSARIGCSISALRKIEDGERRPSVQIAELIANSLNVPPEQRLTFVRVARGELGVGRLLPESNQVAPIRTTFPKTNLPIFPTPLIGREGELGSLSQLLRGPQCRLLTLVGPGGIGKTRLAIETASQLQDVFTDGVHFVPLASVNATDFIVPVIADSVGFAFQGAGSTDPKMQLFSYLREKQELLLIDNVEQLLTEPGVEVLVELLAHAPRVKMLVTSRESLEFQEAWVYEVQGLPIPEQSSEERDVQNTCVELFLQRARRSNVGFNAMRADYPAIVRVCQLVEGNPLAIELAASWVRTLSCTEIAEEIERGLDFLSVSARDLPARHHSMRAVFDHSWKLLTEEEQGALLRLSVFRGGFTREAAQQVAGVTLELLSALVIRSLIHRSRAGRYDLHELIRQYGAERFAERSEEQAEVRARHGRFYLSWITEQTALISSRQKEIIEQLTFEIDNVRQAWGWAIDQRMIELLRVAAWPLWHSYEVRDLYREGEVMFLQAVQSMSMWNSTNELDKQTCGSTIAYLQVFQASLVLRQGRIEEAKQVLKECLNPLTSANDRVGLANALLMYGVAYMFNGQPPKAIECLQEALVHALATNRQWEQCLARVVIGRMKYQLGDYNESKRWIAEGLALAQKMGDPNLIPFSISSLVETEQALGELDGLEALLRGGMQVATDNGRRFTYGMLEEQLALVLHSTGNTSEAQQLCQESVDLYRELGDEWSKSRALNVLGNFKLEEDKPNQALDVFLDALEVAYKAHSNANALDALTGIAAIQAATQNSLFALELSLCIVSSPYATHQAQNAGNRLLKELEARLEPEQLKAAKTLAQSESLDQIVEKVAHLTTR